MILQLNMLQKAFDSLMACRQILMLSYIFSYFAIECNDTVILEQNQRDLEIAVDTLSGYLQMEFTAENFPEIKLKIWDKSGFVVNSDFE